MIQLNWFLSVFLFLFLAAAGFRLFLSRLNLRNLKKHGQSVPEVFAGTIDKKTLERMTGYTLDSSRFGMMHSLFDDGFLLAILLSGILPWYGGIIEKLHLPFVVAALLFLAGYGAAEWVFSIPFDLYSTFVIEKRHGFSTTTLKLWIGDLFKSFVISAILAGILLSAFFALMRGAPNSWWFWAWLLFASFQLLALWLYPVLIAPLFNKYEPVADDTLRDEIIALMAKAGLTAKAVLQVDEGKRSRHSNAYFTGLGKTKRIVLYDTLLSSHDREEILAILAHEIGHWKKRHIMKQLLFMEAASLTLFYLTYRLLEWPYLYRTFGFDQILPYAGLILLSAAASPAAFFISPALSCISRKFEREADEYSKFLIGSTAALSTAMKRLAKDNLSNLHPHPFYAWFYYSHPPLPDRISYLESIDRGCEDGKTT